jgi:hypothetical protein
VARFLGGDRVVTIVDTSAPPRIDLRISVPVADMTNPGTPAEETGERGLWPTIYPELLALLRSHRTTIVFVNSRGLCERLSRRLNEAAGEELVLAHHGSIAHDERARIEERLKAGTISGIVATSSLELGIDRAPQLVADKELVGDVRVDPEREIAANKITALLGRTAPRDLVDLFALLHRGHALESALADARRKDAAVDPGTLAWVLSQWRIGPDVPLPVGISLDDIERMRASFIERLLMLAVPRE